MDPLEYLRAIRRRWHAVAGAVTVALVVAFLTTSITPVGLGPRATTYEASAVLLDLGASSAPGDVNLDTIARLTTVGAVPGRVAKAIDFEGEPLVLAGRVTATADTASGILEISSTSTDPDEAKRIANGFSRELLGYLEERKAVTFATQSEPIQKQLDELSEHIARLDEQIDGVSPRVADTLNAKRSAKLFTYTTLSQQFELLRSAALTPSGLRIIQRAVPVPLPETGFQAPRTQTGRLLLAGILGLFAGIVLALVLERSDRSIRTKSDAERTFALPVLAEIPRMPRSERAEIVTAAHPSSLQASAFRLLRMGIDITSRELVTRENGWRVGTILVTSPAPGEGKSTVVANLAATYAETRKSVIVLSCDLRRPTVHQLFGVPGHPGITDIVRGSNGRTALGGHALQTSVPRVRVVPAGRPPENPAKVMETEAMRTIIREARSLADIVILDSPPILVDSDATALLSEVDAVVLVARAGKTSREIAERSCELLMRLGAPIVGVALVEAEPATHTYEYSPSFRRSQKSANGHNESEQARTVPERT